MRRRSPPDRLSPRPVVRLERGTPSEAAGAPAQAPRGYRRAPVRPPRREPARHRRRPLAEFSMDRGLCAARVRRAHLQDRAHLGPRRLPASQPDPLPARRKLDPAAVTWAVSLGLPSADPAEWRSDVTRARAKLHPHQILIVSVVGTPVPDGDPEQLAGDYALAARWAAEAGADVVEVHLSSPNTAGEHAQMIFENP